MGRVLLVLALLTAPGWAQESVSPLEKYRALKFPPTSENFDKGWEERVALEFDIINGADLPSLRTARRAPDPSVGAIAPRALGILGDRESVEPLAGLAKGDPEPGVRMRA